MDTGEASTTTSSTGADTLAGLPTSSYKIRAVTPISSMQTLPTGGYGYTLTLSAGQGIVGDNFGEQATVVATCGSISGTVTGGGVGEAIYLDANNNSVLDSTKLKTTTGSTGAYSFNGVPAGAYNVRQVLPGGYTQTAPASNGGIHITVINGSTSTEDNFTDEATATNTASISGTVFNDANANGLFDSTESGLGLRQVYIDANNDEKYDIGSTLSTTDINGVWTFTADCRHI